jgi:ribose transport system permease protein
MIVVYLIAHFVLNRTKLGRYTYAIGGNEEAAILSGIMYELDAIAATVIGGTSLMGGEGRIVDTLIGALIMGVLRNGLNHQGISSFVQQIVIGSVIIIAVLIDMALKKRNN